LLRAYRDFSVRSVEKLRARGHAGLGLEHTALLIHLDTDGTRITTLAERAGVTKQAMGQLVRELEQRGYISRIDDPSDRRAALISFTALGWQFLLDAQAVKHEIEAEYSALLGQEGLAQLRALLSLLIDAAPAAGGRGPATP
jgi:DNA-binding MarR family transcriptional regulator